MIDRQTYRVARANGARAIDAFREATPDEPGLIAWDDLDDHDARYPVMLRAVAETEGGTLTVELIADESPGSLDDMTSVTWKERTWRTREYEHEADTGNRTRIDCFTRAIDDGRGTTLIGDMTVDFRTLVDWHRKSGASRAVAWELAVKGCEQMAEYAHEILHGDRAPFGIVATFRDPAGHEVGYEACWGFDHNSSSPREIRDLVREINAIAEQAVEVAQTRTLSR